MGFGFFGQAAVAIVPTVFDPLPDIAMHVMQSKRVGWITAHKAGLAVFTGCVIEAQ